MLALVVTILASVLGAAVVGLALQPHDDDAALQAEKRRSSRAAWGIVLVCALVLFIAFWLVIEAIRQIQWP